MQNNIKKAVVATGAVAFALSMTAAAPSQAAGISQAKMVKCYGVVAKGKNDCQTKNHSCAGEAKTDNAVDEWILIPKNICKKLANSGVGKPRA